MVFGGKHIPHFNIHPLTIVYNYAPFEPTTPSGISGREIMGVLTSDITYPE